MKKLFTFSTPGLCAMVAGLGFGFYFATATTGSAQEKCQVCHKGKRTLELPCQSSAVERHIAHGDTAGPCPSTQSAKKIDSKTTVVAQKKAVAPATVARVQKAVE